jgi:hypothetical protein
MVCFVLLIKDIICKFWRCTLAEYLLAAEEIPGDQLKQRGLATFIPVYTALLEALIIRAQVRTLESSDLHFVLDVLLGKSRLMNYHLSCTHT